MMMAWGSIDQVKDQPKPPATTCYRNLKII